MDTPNESADRNIRQKQISTGIRGFDEILFNGIVMNFPHYDNNGTIILIKGKHGVRKATLAKKLLLNMTSSIVAEVEKVGTMKNKVSRYYSINKKTENIADKFIDLYLSAKFQEFQTDYVIDADKLSKFKEFINENFSNSSITNLEDKLDKIFYDTISNSLCFCNEEGGKEIVAYRKFNQLNTQDSSGYDFNISINEGLNNYNDNSSEYIYDSTPLTRLNQIFSEIEKIPKDDILPCIVIDGINLLTPDEFSQINFNWLTELLKSKAYCSFILTDETNSNNQDHYANLVINMEAVDNQSIGYRYYQLHINNTAMQKVAFGKHTYKVREANFELFPSAHLLIQGENANNVYLNSFSPSSIKNESSNSSNNDSPQSNVKTILSNIILHNRKKSIPKLQPERHGSLTALIGPRGTYKKKLSMDFLLAGAANPCKPEHSLLISITDNEQALDQLQYCSMYGSNTKCPNCIVRTECTDQRNCYVCQSCISKIHKLTFNKCALTTSEFFCTLINRLKAVKNTENEIKP